MYKNVTVGMTPCSRPKPISMLVQLANQFSCCIYLGSANQMADAKDFSDIGDLNLKVGDQVTLYATGTDEEKAIEKLEHFFSIM